MASPAAKERPHTPTATRHAEPRVRELAGATTSCIRRRALLSAESRWGTCRRRRRPRGGWLSWARYYHPTLQRFISEDPIELESGDTNFYLYVGDNPLTFIDPLGLDKKKNCPSFGARYFAHLNAYLVDVGPYAVLLAGGLWPKSLAPATGGRGPLLGSDNPLTSVPRAFGIAGAGSAIARTGAAGIGVATVGIGYYNVGVFTSGLAYAAFPGWNGLPVPAGCE